MLLRNPEPLKKGIKVVIECMICYLNDYLFRSLSYPDIKFIAPNTLFSLALRILLLSKQSLTLKLNQSTRLVGVGPPSLDVKLVFDFGQEARR